MDYFYIASGLASLLSFFGFVTVGRWPSSAQKQVVTYGVIFAFLTVTFWAWFYIVPGNVVQLRIWERTIATRLYSDPATGVGIAEGEFTIDDFGLKTVVLPPFQTAPSVTLYRDDAGPPPPVKATTADSFTVEPFSNSQFGEWSFRARGQLLSASPR